MRFCPEFFLFECDGDHNFGRRKWETRIELKREGLKCSDSSKCSIAKVKVYRIQETFGLEKKAFLFTVLVLMSAAFLYVPFSLVLGQQLGTNITAVNPKSGTIGSQVSVQGTIDTANGSYLIYFGDKLVVNNTSAGYYVDANFTVPDLPVGKYNITLQDATSRFSATQSFSLISTGISAIPLSTVLIMLITIVVSLINMSINRLLINRMVGWEEYRTIQKEVNEYRSQMMQATRTNDKKLLEKLKKKETQIQRMQMKISKPTFILIPISFSYILIWWFFLTPVYGANPVAYVPGIGAIPVLYWYMICSFLFGTLAGRIIGTTPIQ
jgi:uncharacterized membrane protein (DUF106 family)